MNTLQNILARFALQYNRTAQRQVREIIPDLLTNPAVRLAQHPPELVLITVIDMRPPHKVEHRQVLFFLVQAQPATQLLQENRQTLRRAQKKQGVNFRNIHPFVEHIHHKQVVDLPPPQPVQQHGPLAAVGGGEGRSAVVFLQKSVPHILGMLLRHAKAQRARRLRVFEVLLDAANDIIDPPVIARVYPLQRIHRIPAPAPLEARQIRRIGNAKVLKGAEQPAVERLCEPHLRRDAVAKKAGDVAAVMPLGRSRKPQQYGRAKGLQQPLVAASFAVVHLINHYIVVKISRQRPAGQLVVEGLHRRKQVLVGIRPKAVYPQLPKVAAAQHLPKAQQRLLQDLLAVGHKKQPRSRPLAAEAEKIKCSHHRLARARSGNHQVFIFSPAAASRQLVENFLLKREGAEGEKRQLPAACIATFGQL